MTNEIEARVAAVEAEHRATLAQLEETEKRRQEDVSALQGAIERLTAENAALLARAAAAEARARDLRQLSASDNCEIIKLRVRDREQAARIVALEGALREARLTVHGIAEAARFDREVFDDDASFADWAQSRARHATGKIDAALAPTAPTAGAGERKLCGRPIDDEHGNPTDQPCGFTRPCIYHDAPKAKCGETNPPTPAPEAAAGQRETCGARSVSGRIVAQGGLYVLATSADDVMRAIDEEVGLVRRKEGA